MDQKEMKFKQKSELELFKALQKYGKLSNESLSRKTGIPATTIQGIYNRIDKRDFFNIMAVPRLDVFSEIPMALIGFSDYSPIRLVRLEEKMLIMNQVLAIIRGEKELFLIIVEENKDRLTELIFDIMEAIQARPVLRILSPSISKLDITIPDEVLDSVYADLPDKRRK